MSQLSNPVWESRPHFSIVSLLAIAAAIVSFFVHPGIAFALAVVAIVLGCIGMLLAFAPSIRGGITSFVSVLAGVAGVIVAIVRIVI